MDVLESEIRTRQEEGRELPVLMWRFGAPVRCASSAVLGGGIGVRRWVINAQVAPSYGRRDPDRHLSEVAAALGLRGLGVAMMTAADVEGASTVADLGVRATATVGLGHTVLAAAPDDAEEVLVGTINSLVWVPERLGDAALVNAVATATEAKGQALRDMGIDATGTATDAVCVACPAEGRPNAFGGPRSTWGSRVARAVHAAVLSAPADRVRRG